MLAGKARRSGVTHMLHGCLGCRWTPAHKGGVPPRSAQYYRCGWYKDTHSAPQTAPAPSPRIGDAWSPSLTPGAPAATAGEPRAQEESNPAAWSLSSGWAAQAEARKLRELQISVWSLYIPNRLLTPLFSFSCPPLLAPALPLVLPPPTNSPPSEEQVRTAPYSVFVWLSSSNSCFSLSPWALVKYMLFALLVLQTLLLQVAHPTAPLGSLHTLSECPSVC